jgi:hypothetical protein
LNDARHKQDEMTMAQLDKIAVRCPVYIFSARVGTTCGCGRTDLAVVPRQDNLERYVCKHCGMWFTRVDVDWDRLILADPRRRALEDARITDGRYIS